jgi:hypothetical protein
MGDKDEKSSSKAGWGRNGIYSGEEGNKGLEGRITDMNVGGRMPQEEQQDLIFKGLGCESARPFWEFAMPSRTVPDVDSCICIVLASTFSWYSHLETTRFAI